MKHSCKRYLTVFYKRYEMRGHTYAAWGTATVVNAMQSKTLYLFAVPLYKENMYTTRISSTELQRVKT